MRLGQCPGSQETPLEKSLTTVPAKGHKNGARAAADRGKRWFCRLEERIYPEAARGLTSVLDTCWRVFGFCVRSLLLRVNFPWSPALTSQQANDCRASGDARACYSAFVERSKARWRPCQLKARMPEPGLAPGSARPATGLGMEELGAEPEPGVLCKRKVNILDWRPGKTVLNMTSQFPEFLETPSSVAHVAGW